LYCLVQRVDVLDNIHAHSSSSSSREWRKKWTIIHCNSARSLLIITNILLGLPQLKLEYWAWIVRLFSDRLKLSLWKYFDKYYLFSWPFIYVHCTRTYILYMYMPFGTGNLLLIDLNGYHSCFQMFGYYICSVHSLSLSVSLSLSFYRSKIYLHSRTAYTIYT
jgi:hypothetical protein